jgi:ligand-binding SRPBCC domain-containing protein
VLGKSTPTIADGTLIRYRLKLHGVPIKWVTKISEWHPEHGFVDEQLKGPYAKWVHRHTFEPFAGGTLMTDYVRFRLPMGMLGNIAAGWAVTHDVAKIFAFRREYIDKIYRP